MSRVLTIGKNAGNFFAASILRACKNCARGGSSQSGSGKRTDYVALRGNTCALYKIFCETHCDAFQFHIAATMGK